MERISGQSKDVTEGPRKGRVFYGWWIAAVSFVVLMFHAGAAFYAFGRFMPTLIEELGSSTSAVSGAISVYLLLLGLTGPVVGRLADKYGPKWVILGGGVIAAAAFMLLSLTSELWHLYVLYFMLGIGMSGAGNVPVSVAISNWFAKRMGLVMGITMAGISVGAVALAPLAHFLIEAIGWRGAYLAMGGLTAVCIVPAVLLVMKTRPEDKGLLPDGARPGVDVAPSGEADTADMAAAPPAQRAWTMSMALKSVPFWLIVVTFFLSSAGVAGVLQHEVNIMSGMGIPLAAASVALGLTGLIGGGGKIGFGFVADKMSPKYTAVLCIALQLVGVVILMFTRSTAMVWLFVVVFGFAMGGNVAVEPLVGGQFFGTASFGAIFGWILLGGAVGAAVGPILMGIVFDASGSYTMGLVIFIAAYAAAVGALLLARVPRQATGVAVP